MKYRIVKESGAFSTHYYPQYRSGFKWNFFEYFDGYGPKREVFHSLNKAKAYIRGRQKNKKRLLVAWEYEDE